MDAVLANLGYQSEYVIEDGHVWTHGLGEMRRYAIQHRLRYQIWELDQPDYSHAHGRSLHGHAVDADEATRHAALRDQFTDEIRYDNDY